MENNKPLDHEYDGIQELDNPLPQWWLATFYGAILFSVLYVGYYHYGSGPSHREELEGELAALKALHASTPPSGPSEDMLAAAFADPQKRKAGNAVFQEKCSSCHGTSGQGGIGPNLTDTYWLHGKGGLTDLYSIVSSGVPEKGMPPWAAILKEPELLTVVAYIKELQGTKPANAKAPQGLEVK